MSVIERSVRDGLLRELTESKILNDDQAREFCRLLTDESPVDTSKLLSIFKNPNDELKK